jgi:outer membrane protein OmpA-like peptidoglycan-associated protein
MKQLIILSFALFGWQCFGQSYKTEYAQSLSDRLEYQKAYPIWCELADEALENKQADLSPVREAANIAFMMEKYDEALRWDSLLISLNSTVVQDYTQFFELLCLNKKYDDLKSAIDLASQRFNGQADVMQWADNLNEILELQDSKSDFIIGDFKTRSKGEEFCAVPFENIVLYVSTNDDAGLINSSYKRTGQEFLSICYLDTLEQDKNKIWQKKFWSRLFFQNQWREIEQSTSHDGPISFSKDGKMAFLTRNHPYWDTINKVKYARLEQRVFLKNAKTWEEIPFPFNSHLYSNGHAVMDTNGWIVFVTDNPEYTMGGTDLVKTKLEMGKWTTPMNLGSQVNTKKNELFPFVSSDGVLYFSSNGWPGLGGLDIYSYDFFSDKPEHIGAPINTHADDFGFSINEETGHGFISSNRASWNDKIYTIYKEPFKCVATVNLTSCRKEALVDRTVLFTDLKSKKVQELKTNDKGQITISTLEKGRSYQFLFKGEEDMTADSLVFESVDNGNLVYNLNSNYTKHLTRLRFEGSMGERIDNIVMYTYQSDGKVKNQYVSTNSNFSFLDEGATAIDSITLEVVNYEDVRFSIPKNSAVECIDTLVYSLKLTQLPDSQYIQIKNILYDFDKYNLRPESQIELDKLVSYMNEHPKYKVELQSHTDCRGSYSYNERLSENRSKSCVDYILSEGISRTKITAKGYGEYQLLEDCPCEDEVDSDCTIQQHQLNRRTVFLLITPENQVLDNNKLKVD